MSRASTEYPPARPARIAAGLAAMGAIAIMTSACDSPPHLPEPHHVSVAELKAHLDKVPLPAGAKLTGENDEPGQSVASASVARAYHVPATETPLCKQLLQGIANAGYKIGDGDDPIDVNTCNTVPPNPHRSVAAGTADITEPDGKAILGIGWEEKTGLVQLSLDESDLH